MSVKHYWRRILITPVLFASIRAKYAIKGMAHITGGGLLENIPRVLPEVVQLKFIKISGLLPFFPCYCDLGHLTIRKLYRTFNMGVGL